MMLFTAVAFPVMMMLIFVVMFRGMIERFTGAPVDLPRIWVMIVVSSMLTGAIMGAGSTVQERREGFMDRIRTLPAHASAGYAGRILAESLRAFLAAPLTMLIALVFGADFGSPAAVLRMLAVLLMVAIASGAFGVMMGYLAETPQGAVAASPAIMAAMFFNTAMMPSERYAAPLRPIVDVSPITAVANLSQDALAGGTSISHITLFVLWFGGLVLLSVAVIAFKARLRR
ncbi:ABC-type multidrug transport system, permease component [Gulosibacter sp. 10]|nr:ABC-type multidrug transport system, permease component [Gulosibacter sp. 10]